MMCSCGFECDDDGSPCIACGVANHSVGITPPSMEKPTLERVENEYKTQSVIDEQIEIGERVSEQDECFDEPNYPGSGETPAKEDIERARGEEDRKPNENGFNSNISESGKPGIKPSQGKNEINPGKGKKAGKKGSNSRGNARQAG